MQKITADVLVQRRIVVWPRGVIFSGLTFRGRRKKAGIAEYQLLVSPQLRVSSPLRGSSQLLVSPQLRGSRSVKRIARPWVAVGVRRQPQLKRPQHVEINALA